MAWLTLPRSMSGSGYSAPPLAIGRSVALRVAQEDSAMTEVERKKLEAELAGKKKLRADLEDKLAAN